MRSYFDAEVWRVNKYGHGKWNMHLIKLQKTQHCDTTSILHTTLDCYQQLEVDDRICFHNGLKCLVLNMDDAKFSPTTRNSDYHSETNGEASKTTFEKGSVKPVLTANLVDSFQKYTAENPWSLIFAVSQNYILVHKTHIFLVVML